MSDEKLRLKKLIEHWAKHNDEHARAKGLDRVAENLLAAANKSAEVSYFLRKAIEAFK